MFIRAQHLFHFSLPKCGVYWRAAFKRGNTVYESILTVKDQCFLYLEFQSSLSKVVSLKSQSQNIVLVQKI